jgi:YD repeat-containing protein
MTDLAQSNVHGPVETLRTEWAEWDPAKEDWQPDKQQTLIRFRPDGQISEIEHHNPDGSTSLTTYTYNEAGEILETRSKTEDGAVKTTYSYDGSGRIVRRVIVDENGNVGGSEVFNYDAGGRKTGIYFHPGQQRKMAKSGQAEKPAALFTVGGGPDPITITTTYHDYDQPAEVLIHNAAHLLLRRTIYTRDSAGRLAKEEVYMGAGFPEIETRFKDAPPEVRESIAATISTVFGPNKAMSTTTYTYDQNGRQAERVMSMGPLGERRTSFRFDDRDNPTEEISEDTSRDVGLDAQGNPQPTRESFHKQHTRYVYKYDAEGNWTEREVWIIFEPNKDFQRSNIERRQITYYQPALR